MQESRHRNKHHEAEDNFPAAKNSEREQASDHERKAMRPPTSSFARALWNFSSQWFLIPQGNGIIAVILHQLDYQFRGLTIISVVLWIYTIVLLVVGLSLYTLRILLHHRHVAHMLKTSITETSCLASIPITFTTIIQMTVLVLVRQWGAAWGIVAYVLWWVNTAMAVVVVMGIPYVFVRIQPPGVKAILPGVLLPLISTLTSAAGGGVICRYGALSSRLQVPVIIVSFLEVGLGLALAVTLADTFMTRLFDKSFPSVEEIYQDMILCGPFGQGSFALQILGQAVSRDAFAEYNRGTFLTAEAAKPIAFASELAGLLVWGYGTFWWCFAIISISHTFISRTRHRQQTSFTLTAWSLVFPWVSLQYPRDIDKSCSRI
jgi:tellurite resistance protein TehA-like permease